MNSRYNAVLDIFALVATYPKEASALRVATQKTAIAYARKKASKSELKLLLCLAKDLHYVEEDLHDLHTSFLR